MSLLLRFLLTVCLVTGLATNVISQNDSILDSSVKVDNDGTKVALIDDMPNQKKVSEPLQIKNQKDSISMSDGKDSIAVTISDSKKDSSTTSQQINTIEEGDKFDELSSLISGNNIFYSIVLILIGFVFVRVVSYVLNALAERSTKYRIAFKGSIPIVKIIAWVLVLLLIIVTVFQPSLATMLAFSASIGVAIGFASQDILKNIFGGIVILLDRPFVSGDKIEVDKYYGEVVEIGLRSTRIVTPDDSLVSVPNAVMMNSSLSNANAGEPNCQVVAEIFLPLSIDPIKIRGIATQAARVSKYIYLDKPITVLFFNEINNQHSYYKMKVKAYVMDIRDEFKFKSDMTELIIGELVKEGILDGKL